MAAFIFTPIKNFKTMEDAQPASEQTAPAAEAEAGIGSALAAIAMDYAEEEEEEEEGHDSGAKEVAAAAVLISGAGQNGGTSDNTTSRTSTAAADAADAAAAGAMAEQSSVPISQTGVDRDGAAAAATSVAVSAEIDADGGGGSSSAEDVEMVDVGAASATAVSDTSKKVPADTAPAAPAAPASTSAPASAATDVTVGAGCSGRRVAESALNVALLDPDRYGWTAFGGIADLATPHQRARSSAASRQYQSLCHSIDRREQDRDDRTRRERKMERRRMRDKARAEMAAAQAKAQAATAAASVARRMIQLHQQKQQMGQQQQQQQQQQRQQNTNMQNGGGKLGGYAGQSSASFHPLSVSGASVSTAGSTLGPNNHHDPMQAKLQDAQRRHGKALAAAGVTDSLGAAAAAAAANGGSGAKGVTGRRATNKGDNLKGIGTPSSIQLLRQHQSPSHMDGFASPAATNDAAASLLSLSSEKAKTAPASSGVGTATRLSEEVTNYLKAWVSSPDHAEHPYPTDDEKRKLLADTGITETQLNNWFNNYRKKQNSKKSAAAASPGASSSGRKRGGGPGSNAKASPAAAAVPPLPPPPLSPEASISSSPKNQVIMPRPTDDAGTLDIHAYHRGRAGCEPRCPQSGDLLCDVDPNDTGQLFALKQKVGEKKFVVRININFPLCDVEDLEDVDDSDGGDEEKVDGDCANATHPSQRKSSLEAGGGALAISASSSASRFSRNSSRQMSRGDSTASQQSRMSNVMNKRMENVPQFHDMIEWDLSSPDTPTPISYATSIASDFGLSFGQTLDVATSIQKQIDAFIREKDLVRPLPIGAKDPLGVPRAAGTTIALVPMLYGGTHTSGGGSVQVTTELKKGNLSRSGSRVGGASRKSGSSNGADRPRGQVKKSSAKYEVVPAHLLPSHETMENKYKIGVEYRREVVSRAKTELQRDMVKRAAGDDASLGLVKFVKDDVCHICHHRKSTGVEFCCNGHHHVYCDYHCATRLGFPAKEAIGGAKTLDYCPICSLSCLCSKCCRKLDEVSGHFMRLCQNQGVMENPAECKVDNILGLCSGMIRASAAPKATVPSNSSNRSKPERKKKRAPEPVVVAVEDMASPGSTRALRRQPEPSRQQTKSSDSPPRSKKIARPPMSEFPVETCGGFDLDPSRDDDRRTVYLPGGGSYIRKDDLMPQHNVEDVQLVGADTGIVEDGSVDYCHACRKGGSLICCDRCPRSYHADCLPEGLTQDHIPDSDWECHLCVRDSSPQPNNDITGERHLGLIAASYTDVEHCDCFTEKLLTLSKIHELLVFLSVFDFGNLFKEPVSAKEVPNYTKIVKKPMDLSTIRANIVNGKYAKNAKKQLAKNNVPASQITERILDETALSALKDLELIYHNCFTYNVRGTAIYRMAEVQRRKARMVIQRSIEPHLNKDAMKALDDYALHLKQAREVRNRKSGPKKVSMNRRNKIQVPFVKGGTGRIVAVFDPTKNMVVKQYTTLRAAVQAALFIAQLGYASEVSATDYCIKSLVRKSGHNPSLVLFQYRWFYLDDLRAGLVVVAPPKVEDESLPSNGNKTTSPVPGGSKMVKSSRGKKAKSTKKDDKKSQMKPDDEEEEDNYWIERRGNRGLSFYNSIDAAHGALNKDKILAKSAIVPLEAFKEALQSVAPGDDVVTMGSKWRRIKKSTSSNGSGIIAATTQLDADHVQGKKQEEKEGSGGATNSSSKSVTSSVGSSSNVTSHPGVATVLSLGGEAFFETSMEPAMTDCFIIKTDRMSGVVMGGFESFDSAFEDWKTVRDGALCSAGVDPTSLEVFKQDYVYGHKNIEGVEWNLAKPLEVRWKKRPREFYEAGGVDPLRATAKARTK